MSKSCQPLQHEQTSLGIQNLKQRILLCSSFLSLQLRIKEQHKSWPCTVQCFSQLKQVVLYSFIYYIFIYSQTDSLENLQQFQLYMQYASALKPPFFNLLRIDIVTFYVAIPPCFEKRIKPQAPSLQQVEDYTITACIILNFQGLHKNFTMLYLF